MLDAFLSVGAQSGAQYEVVFADICNGGEFDLSEQSVFEEHMGLLESGYYAAVVASPPCSTYSIARKRPCGPPQLRGPNGSDVYGFAWLQPDDKERVRLGTLLALRALAFVRAAAQKQLPHLLENPVDVENDVGAIYALPEYKQFAKEFQVKRTLGVQCELGASSVKPTELWSSFDISLPTECTHPPCWWFVPSTGEWKWRSHAPLIGKERAISEQHWREGGFALRASSGFVTRAASAYPAALNQLIAEAVDQALRVQRPATIIPGQPPAEQWARVGRWGQTLVRVTDEARPAGIAAEPGEKIFEAAKQVRMLQPLRGSSNAPREPEAIGGLRRTAVSVGKLPGLVAVGQGLRAVVREHFDQDPEFARRCVAAIGDASPDAGPTDAQLRKLRQAMGQFLGTTDVDPLPADIHDCTICGGLLEAWTRAAGDPDAEAAAWPRLGTPAGIEVHPGQPGVFPTAKEPADIVDVEDQVFAPPEMRESYKSVEVDDFAWDEVARLASRGFLQRFDRLEDLEEELGGQQPVISKFGLVLRERLGIVKRRLILDSKESGITACARKNQRILLPQATDLIFDLLRMRADWADVKGADVEAMVLDVTEAFWTLPLNRRERRYFVGRLRKIFFLYRRLAQGSRGAPLAWCRFFGLILRLTQGAFRTWEVLLEGFVDDPVATVGGFEAERTQHIAVIVALWRSLNIELAFKKGQRGQQITWIGFAFRVYAECVVVEIMEESYAALLAIFESVRGQNVLPVKSIRSLAGKLMNIARLLEGWRPFLAPFWRVLRDADRGVTSGAPPNTIWRKQVDHALQWFGAFLAGHGAGVRRTYHVEHFLAPASRVLITVDASPWGLGGWLSVDGAPVAWFADAIHAEDIAQLGIDVGSPEGQQVLECLAAVAALRAWRDHWLPRRCSVSVRGDNMTMLSMISTLGGLSPAVNLLTREAALLFSAACYRPVGAEHAPGVANAIADALSRRFQPSKQWAVPPALASVPETILPRRRASWYLSAGDPSACGTWETSGQDLPCF